MKAIIAGKRYDTKTAQELAQYWNGLGGSDFRSIQESLYKTTKGAYFVAGEGGAMTEYAEQHGNAFCSGERIRPLTAAEAAEWLESHNEHEVLEREFPSHITDA